jgi:catechol 2,3-dioxygenase-like lactoylglutathione lyase family enzyme
VHLPVTDVNRAIEFYGRLGFQVGRRESGARALLLYSAHGTRWMLGLIRAKTEVTSRHISFRVPERDVDGMIPYLLQRGIDPVHPPRSPTQGPMQEPIVHGSMPAAAVFFRDPDGHLLIADLSDPPRPEFLYSPLSNWRALSRA